MQQGREAPALSDPVASLRCRPRAPKTGMRGTTRVRTSAGRPSSGANARLFARWLRLGQRNHARGASDEAIAQYVRSVKDGFSLTSGSPPNFVFHRHTPPLRTIDFAELSPSNSVRMDLTSLFADISGFTAYVSGCIRSGRVAEMVANLHVIRNELAATLKEDFSGRKVRFIGDCVHGLLAEGTRDSTDTSRTVTEAVKAAAGMRSGFELCQTELPNVDDLGLAVGIEYGTTPITRIGIRGDRSVRCSVSKAVSASESLQSDCEGEETALGPRALALAPAGIKRLLDGGVASGLDYDAVAAHLSAPAVVRSGNIAADAKPYTR
jgi:class 3 adenylate cyclase